MSDHNEYLNALDAHLTPHLSEELRRRRVEEIRTHLELDQADRESAGADSIEAARLARVALGSPKVLARQMIRQARGYDTTSSMRLTWASGLALNFAYAVPFLFLVQGPSSWANAAIHWLPFFVLIYFGCVVARTQRWLVGPMAAWALIAVLITSYISVIAVPAWKPASAQTLQSFHHAIQTVAEEESRVKAWQRGTPLLTQAPIAYQNAVTSTYLPMIPVSYSSSEFGYALSSTDNPTEAKRLWNANGANYAKEVPLRLYNLRQDLANAEKPPAKARLNWQTMVQIDVYGTLVQIIILTLVNWSVLTLSTLTQRRKNRRDPLLA